MLPPAGVRELLAESDVLVHPSREEAFGMTLIEAMACRTPVVGGQTIRCGAVGPRRGRAGVLADAESPLSLAASVVALLSDPELWRHYSDAGYRWTKASFSTELVVDRYGEAYERLLGQDRR